MTTLKKRAIEAAASRRDRRMQEIEGVQRRMGNDAVLDLIARFGGSADEWDIEVNALESTSESTFRCVAHNDGVSLAGEPEGYNSLDGRWTFEWTVDGDGALVRELADLGDLIKPKR